MTTERYYLLVGAGYYDVVDESDTVEGAAEKAALAGLAWDDYGVGWCIEGHYYRDDGEPVGELPIYGSDVLEGWRAGSLTV